MTFVKSLFLFPSPFENSRSKSVAGTESSPAFSRRSPFPDVRPEEGLCPNPVVRPLGVDITCFSVLGFLVSPPQVQHRTSILKQNLKFLSCRWWPGPF